MLHKREALRILRINSSHVLWGLNISDFKSAWWTQASHTIFKEKLLLEVKLTERKAALLKQNNKEEKEILPFVTQYQPLVSIKWKSGISYKSNHYLDNILKNHLKCYISEKGKLWQPKHKRDRCAACHPLQFFTKNNWSIQKARVHWLINYTFYCAL